MTHEGRMARGEKNFNSNKLLNNADTLYYLENKKAEKPLKQEKKEVKEVKEEKKE